MPTHYISGVWKDTQQRITHVYIHTIDANGRFGMGQKISEQQAINIVKQPGNQVMTLRWDYGDPGWVKGATIRVVKVGTNDFLRTVADAQVIDNLDNMINMLVIV